MSKKFNSNRVFNGSRGKLWINGEERANVKSFEAKVNLSYEELNIADDLGTHQKYTGYSVEGTMVFHKYDTYIGSMMAESIVNGIMPEITLVGRISDPAAYGTERVELTDVTFDEITLLKFANKEIGEEEVPFKAASFKYLDRVA